MPVVSNSFSCIMFRFVNLLPVQIIKRVILNVRPKDIGSMIAGSPGEDPDPKILADFKDLLDKIKKIENILDVKSVKL
jgi:hypothetical protein